MRIGSGDHGIGRTFAVELGGMVVNADERWANALAESPFGRFVRRLG